MGAFLDMVFGGSIKSHLLPARQDELTIEAGQAPRHVADAKDWSKAAGFAPLKGPYCAASSPGGIGSRSRADDATSTHSIENAPSTGRSSAPVSATVSAVG